MQRLTALATEFARLPDARPAVDRSLERRVLALLSVQTLVLLVFALGRFGLGA